MHDARSDALADSVSSTETRNAITSLQYKVHNIRSDALADSMFSTSLAATPHLHEEKREASARLAEKKRREEIREEKESAHREEKRNDAQIEAMERPAVPSQTAQLKPVVVRKGGGVESAVYDIPQVRFCFCWHRPCVLHSEVQNWTAQKSSRLLELYIRVMRILTDWKSP